jgi:hypothetical protein
MLASSVGVVGAKTADQESFDLGGEFQAGGEGHHSGELPAH